MRTSDMQERKNKRLAVLLSALVVVTALVYWLGNRDSDVAVDKDIFRLADYTTIDRVVFESDTAEVELAYQGSRWRVNDSLDADRNLVSVLFATLKQAEPKRAVAASLLDSIDALLETKGVRVSLFEGQSLQQVLIAGGSEAKMQSWFKDPESKDIYLVTIPGYRVYVSGILQLTATQWRNKSVFGFNWRNFKSLEVRYPAKPSESFRVALQNNIFGVVGIRTDTTKLANYMDHVLSLTVNEYLEPGRYTDSLKKEKPLAIVTVSDIADKTYSLKIFPEDAGQVPGLVHENQGAVFSRLKIQPVLRPKSYFSIK